MTEDRDGGPPPDERSGADGRRGPRTLLGRTLRRLRASPEELQAEALRQGVEAEGAVRITACGDRESVRVTGVLRTVTFRPRAGTPALEADLWDGTGSVVLVWLGRRQIGGIRPGRHVVAQGRITTKNQRKIIFNPIYELRPAEDTPA